MTLVKEVALFRDVRFHLHNNHTVKISEDMLLLYEKMLKS